MASNAFTKRQSWSRPARIGFLGATTPKVWSAFVEAFEDELNSLGWVKGDNLEIDYRWAHGEPGNYRSIARGFVKDGVDIIVTSGTAPVRAAMQATSEIPIVFAAAGAPAKTGLKRKNVTGLSNRQPDLAARRIGLLRRLVPKLKRLAYLGNPRVKNSTLEAKQIDLDRPYMLQGPTFVPLGAVLGGWLTALNQGDPGLPLPVPRRQQAD